MPSSGGSMAVWLPVGVFGCLALIMGYAFYRRKGSFKFKDEASKNQNRTYLLREDRKNESARLNIFWENITVLIPENVYIPRDRLTIGEGEVLGKGMSSVVRLGSFGKTQVAIKHMPLQIIEIESGEKPQFLRECDILFNTQHPRICRLYGFSYDSYWFVMVQEWCRGGDLRKAIVKVPDVVEQRACDFMVDVASALDHIHRQQIVHRDIKPENVLLSSEDTLVARCKVCDFGCSRLMRDPSTTLTNGIGTVDYMAPETMQSIPSRSLGCIDDTPSEHASARGKRDLCPYKADIYSAGIMFAEITLPRQELYKGMGMVDVLRHVAIEKRRPLLPSGDESFVPAEILDMIRTMWHHDPGARPNFSEVAVVLDRACPSSSSSNAAAKVLNSCGVWSEDGVVADTASQVEQRGSRTDIK